MSTLTGLQDTLRKSGYCVSPNNIHALPGVIMYPAGPGIPDAEYIHAVQVTTDLIRVYNMFTKETVQEFNSVVNFFSWCPRISEGGVSYDYHW